MPRNETSGFGAHDVTMPQLGMAQDTGKIVSWLKLPGDKVAKGDALFEVETDKATMEVEAQASGFLSHVSAAEGEDVPVGQVIARISDSVAKDAPATQTQADDGDALPQGRQITMPQLGMAQDSGVLVGWLVELGAKVSADVLLFEVETDKATMEVPAGADGYLAATLAQAGDDVPVGQAVAVIADEKPANTVARATDKSAPAPKAMQAPTTKPKAAPAPAPKPRPATSAVAPPASGRILASPKLRRVALEKGLDLALLVQAGHPQPYHMRDLAVLERLSAEGPAPQPGTGAQALRLDASCAHDGFDPFAAWAADTHGAKDADALLAGLAGASLGRAVTVAVDRLGTRRVYHVPAGRRLSAVAPSDAAPDLLLRDLRMSALSGVSIGAEETPVLTLLKRGDGLAIVLECTPAQMAPDPAIALISAFAGRMNDPLRHLL